MINAYIDREFKDAYEMMDDVPQQRTEWKSRSCHGWQLWKSGLEYVQIGDHEIVKRIGGVVQEYRSGEEADKAIQQLGGYDHMRSVHEHEYLKELGR